MGEYRIYGTTVIGSSIPYDPFNPPGALRIFSFVPDHPFFHPRTAQPQASTGPVKAEAAPTVPQIVSEAAPSSEATPSVPAASPTPSIPAASPTPWSSVPVVVSSRGFSVPQVALSASAETTAAQGFPPPGATAEQFRCFG
jgi:hypothetical protein